MYSLPLRDTDMSEALRAVCTETLAWLLSARLSEIRVLVSCGFSKSILYHELSAASLSTDCLVHSVFHGSMPKLRNLMVWSGYVGLPIICLYNESRFHP